MTDHFAKADAVDRSKRTFWQGFGWDLVVAACTALLLWLPEGDLTSREALIALGVSLTKTVLTAAASYVVRVREG